MCMLRKKTGLTGCYRKYMPNKGEHEREFLSTGTDCLQLSWTSAAVSLPSPTFSVFTRSSLRSLQQATSRKSHYSEDVDVDRDREVSLRRRL